MAGKVTLYDAIDSHIQRFADNLYTALPAVVEKYNSDRQTVDVKPTLNVTTNKGQELPWTTIPDVPVMLPSAGGGIISFPIKVGDNVLLVFSKNSIDKWKAGNGQSVKVESKRQHSVSDAIAIVGLTTPNKSLKPNPDDVEIKFKDQSIKIKNNGGIVIKSTDGVSIGNNTVELIQVLTDLVQAITQITTNTVYGQSPINNIPDFEEIREKLNLLRED